MKKNLFGIIKIDRLTRIQILKFLLVGGSAFILDTGILKFTHETLNFPLYLSTALGTIIGMIYTYILSTIWVFKESDKKPSLILFFTLSLVGLLINIIIVSLSRFTPSISYLFYKVLATGVVMVWNFLMRKLVIYK